MLSRYSEDPIELPLDDQEPAAPPSGRTRRSLVPPDIEQPPHVFLIELLQRIERAQGTSLIAFSAAGEQRLGELLISNGRVCLVRMSAGQQVLGQRLAERHPETAAAVREALAIARAEGSPLGDVLIQIGSVDHERIREALLDQIAAGLSEIGQAAPGGLFEAVLSGSGRQISSVLSGFDPLDIYWRSIPLLLPRREDAASRCYDTLASLAGQAVLLFRESGSAGAVPILARGLPPGTLGELLQLGRDVEAIGAPPALLAAEIAPRLLMMSTPDDAAVFVITQHQIAMFSGLAAGARARVLGGARDIVLGAP